MVLGIEGDIDVFFWFFSLSLIIARCLWFGFEICGGEEGRQQCKDL